MTLEDKINNFTFNGESIPDHMIEGIVMYIEHGVIPGDFLQAVISNDLKGAARHADHANLPRLHVYAALLYNIFPASSQGSKEIMMSWSKYKTEVRNAINLHR